MSGGSRGGLLELRVQANGCSCWAFVDTMASECEDELGALLHTAEHAFAARLYRQARSAYQELTRRHPELAFVHRRLGAIEMAGDRAAAAVPHFERARQLHPGSGHESSLELAEAYRQQGRPAAALQQ